MGWRFPRKKPRAGQIMSAIDFDEGLRPFVDELGHYEDENFNESLKGQLVEASMATDVHRRIAICAVENDDDDRTLPDFQFVVSVKDAWVPIDDLEKPFTSFGGTLSLSSSMQVWRPPGPSELGGWKASNLYAQFAFEVDGSVITESVIGDQDTHFEGVSMETGMEGLVYSTSGEAVITITPGSHLVRVMARLIHGPQRYGTNPGNLNNASDPRSWGSLYVGSRELVIIEDT